MGAVAIKYSKTALCFLLAISLFPVNSFAGQEPKVEVFSVFGEAEALIAPDTQWKKVAGGMLLGTGDSIKTKPGAYVEIAFDKDAENVVGISENTHTVILLKNNEKIELVDGEVYATINNLPEGSAFEIRTPTAVCGARGTDWITKADKNETIVEAYEGEPFIVGVGKDGKFIGGETVVRPGYRSAARRFKKPSAPKKLAAARRDHWNAWKGGLKERRSKRGLPKIKPGKPPKGKKKPGKEKPPKRAPKGPAHPAKPPKR